MNDEQGAKGSDAEEILSIQSLVHWRCTSQHLTLLMTGKASMLHKEITI